MMTVVLDSAVVIKWYVEENDSDSARDLFDGDLEIHAPDLLPAECANTLWKKVRRTQLAVKDARSILRAVQTLPIRLHASSELLEAAWHFAVERDRTIHDSLYAALAMAIDCPFVTADAKLANALSVASLPIDIRHLRHWNA
jgi:predicted nucleic acid-binding protein